MERKYNTKATYLSFQDKRVKHPNAKCVWVLFSAIQKGTRNSRPFKFYENQIMLDIAEFTFQEC